MHVLDAQMNSGSDQAPVSSSPVEQASHAAAPQHYGFSQDALTITLTIAFFYVLIYVLHVLERVVRQ